MKNLLRLIPIPALLTATTIASLVGAFSIPHQNKASVPFTPAHSQTKAPEGALSSTQKARAQATLAKIPLIFERNQGQIPGDAQFVSHSGSDTLALSSQEATLWLAAPTSPAPMSAKPTSVSECGTVRLTPAFAAKPLSLRMRLLGANAHPHLSGQQPLDTRVNYLLGKDPKKWQRDIKTVGKVKYDEVYPGVDLVYYGNQGQMEYDFLVAPGADVSPIRMSFSGMERLELNPRGELVLHMGTRTVTQHAPIVYQMVAGERRRVEGRYVLLSKGEVGFQVGHYDHRHELVIDPMLEYSSYFGSTGGRNDNINDIAVDTAGNAYITGSLAQPGSLYGTPPTRLGSQGTSAYSAFFVAKFKPDGSALEYLTIVGNDTAQTSVEIHSLAVDGQGRAFVAGWSYGGNLPVTSDGLITTVPLPDSNTRCGTTNQLSTYAYLMALTAKGDNVSYATYLGGQGVGDICPSDLEPYAHVPRTQAFDVAVNSSGLVAVTGVTNAVNFPVKNALQDHLKARPTPDAGNYNSATRNAFVLVLKGNKLLMSTYLGATGGDDVGKRVAFGPNDSLYACGDTLDVQSPNDFPIVNPIQKPQNNNARTGYVAKFALDGTSGVATSIFSTLVGFPCGTNALAVDENGNALVGGTTSTDSLVTGTGAFQNTTRLGPLGSYDAFIVRLKSDGSAFLNATLLGGSNLDELYDLAVASDGSIYMMGSANGSDFPLKDPVPGMTTSEASIVALKLSPSSQLVYSTRLNGLYTGSSGMSIGNGGMALGATGKAWFASQTYRSDLPTTANALQKMLVGSGQSFIVALSDKNEIVVNSTGDKPDQSTSDGACNTGGTVGAGAPECTLRAAIEQVNAKPALNDIKFKIAVTGTTVPSISITKQLPPITVPLKILGETQPTTKRVQINGIAAGTSSGLIVDGGGSTLTGIVVSNFKTDGILLRTKGGNTVQNCFIGTDGKGAAAQGNGQSGIHTFKSPGNLIGGTKTGEGNIISGNTSYGVWIEDGASKGNLVQGNLIGTNLSGSAKVGKQGIGVNVGPAKYGSSNATIAPIAATIGGTATGMGNVISGNILAGINTESVSGCTIQGNLVGTDKTGLKVLGNGEDDGGIGISLAHSTNNQVGGTTAGARNVASGNVVAGIRLFGAQTSGNHLEGNFVGTDKTGLKALGNGSEGITVMAASGNFIGGPNAEQRNVISGNKGTDGKGKGVFFVVNRQAGFGTNKGVPTNNLVRGNYIGTDATGTKALPNAFGVLVEGGAFNTLRSNVISGNTSVGVVVTKGQTNLDEGEATTLQDNFIGSDGSGTKAVPNGLYGVMLLSQKNALLSGNTISGNGRGGVMLAGKVPTDAFFSNIGNGNLPVNAVLTGNFIGTNKAGTAALPNGKTATISISGAGGIVFFSEVKGATIGGTTSGAGNVIAGNVGAGILVVGSSASPVGVNTITGNFIGTNVGAKNVIANTKSGVSVQFGQGISIASNTIANNGGDGVTILSGSANTITTNSIYSNKLLGIDLGGDGVTPNSTTGAPNSKLPNLGQNSPELLSAQVASGKTTVSVLLKGAAKTAYRVEFFLNATRDTSGYGEGQKFVSATSVTTDSSGIAKFSTALAFALSGTQFLSMTATDPRGNTSEFSGLSRAITGQVYKTITDPKNAKATLKQGLANVRIERLDSKGAVQEATGTDADGNYVFVGVPIGTWTVKPSSKTGTFDIQFDPATRSVVVSANKPTVTGVDFTTYSIFGTVKGVDGKLLANQVVTLAGLNRTARTGTDGTYRFDGLGKATFTVTFGESFSPQSSLVTLPTSGTVGVSPNARVDAQQGLSISGFIEDAAGKPLANVSVELVGSKIAPVVTDKTGRYEFDGLLIGNYKVAPATSAGKFTPAYRIVALKDKNVDSVDFAKVAPSPSPKGFSGNDS